MCSDVMHANSMSHKLAKYGVLGVAAVVISGGIYLAWDFYLAWKMKRKCNRVLTRSMSMGALHGGKMAMQRLIDFHEFRANADELATAVNDMNTLLQMEHPDFRKLESAVAKLEMSGKESEAVKILEEALKKAKDEGRLHEAYEIGMLLVEMLMYKGEFEKALNSKCLKHTEITDARRPLYLGIIHILLKQDKEEAKNYWDEFKEIQNHFHWQPCVDQIQIDSFTEFKKHVKQLESDIKKSIGVFNI